MSTEISTELPTGLRYAPDYITSDYETYLIKMIDELPWNTTLKRRTQQYGHLYKYAGKSTSCDTEIASDIPPFLIDLYKKLCCDKYGDGCDDVAAGIDISKIQIIINEYIAGQGIANHIDDPHQFADWIIAVNLNDAIGLQFTHETKLFRLFVKRRSVYEMRSDARYKWKHGIAAIKTDKFTNYNGLLVNHTRGRRISITFRKIM